MIYFSLFHILKFQFSYLFAISKKPRLFSLSSSDKLFKVFKLQFVLSIFMMQPVY